MNVLDRQRPDSAIPQLEKRIKDIDDGLINRIYPIGTNFYTTDQQFDPNVFWGGEWELTSTSPYEWHRIR